MLLFTVVHMSIVMNMCNYKATELVCLYIG